MRSWQAGEGQIQSLAVAGWNGRAVIASGSHDDSVGVWDARSGKHLYPAIGHPAKVFSVCIAPLASGNPCLLSGCFDGAIRIFDLATGAALGAPLHGHTGPVVSIAVGEWRGRRVILSGSWDGTIRVWDAGDGTALHQLHAHNGSVNSLALLPGRSQPVLISGGSDGFVHIWGPLDRPVASIDLDTFVMRAAPAGNMLAVASGKGLLALRVRF
jgi:WD40 repeat protein